MPGSNPGDERRYTLRPRHFIRVIQQINDINDINDIEQELSLLHDSSCYCRVEKSGISPDSLSGIVNVQIVSLRPYSLALCFIKSADGIAS